MRDEYSVIEKVPIYAVRFQYVNPSPCLPTNLETLDLKRGVKHVVPFWNLIAERFQHGRVSPQFLNQRINQAPVIWIGLHQGVELIFELLDRDQSRHFISYEIWIGK